MNVSKTVKRLSVAFCLALSLSSAASATSYTFSSNDGSGTRNDLNDLDHYKLYVWGIDPASTLGTIASNKETITGASISFKNIYNWANEPNDILKVYLVDNPKVIDTANNGLDVWTATDNQGTSTTTGTLQELTDLAFRTAGTNYRFQSITNLWTWTDTKDLQHQNTSNNTTIVDTNGTETSTTTTKNGASYGHDLIYNFTASEMTTLMGYLSSANTSSTTAKNYATFGLGFDPDCHYYNDGITFTLQTAPINTPVPEPGTMMLLGLGMLGLAVYCKRRMNRDI